MREQSPDYATDKGWAEALKQASLTPEALREKVIESMARTILIRAAAEKEGLKPDGDAVDRQIKSMKENTGEDDAAWRKLLASYGVFDENGLRQILSDRDLDNKLHTKLAEGAKLPEADANKYIEENAVYFKGRSSAQILLTAEDGSVKQQEKLAKKILARLNRGDDFGKLAEKYSRDASSAAQEGTVGWTALYGTGLPKEYTEALAKLDKGSFSGAVKSNLGVHIIKCLDIFEPKGKFKAADVPKPIAKALIEQARQASGQVAYQSYVDKLYDTAKINMNKMPKDVSYHV
jgi:parvulin-like peptidyl-prolyl isomerase